MRALRTPFLALRQRSARCGAPFGREHGTTLAMYAQALWGAANGAGPGDRHGARQARAPGRASQRRTTGAAERGSPANTAPFASRRAERR